MSIATRVMGKGRSAASSWVLNTVSHLQILGLGTDTGDGVPSVLLFFDKRRYLFNVGEGFQRFATQHQVNFKYLSDILLTRVSSDAAGGLPGLCLNLSDALGGYKESVTHLDFYGPTGASDLQHAVHQYVNNTAIHVEGHVLAPAGRPVESADKARCQEASVVLRREEVVISAVELMPEGADSGQGEAGAAAGASAATPSEPSPAATQAQNWPNKRHRLAAAPLLRDGEVPPLASEGAACCYICDLADTPGRFHPEKAAALGVPKGPLFGRLKAGQAVELPDGKTVQPEEVMEASAHGARVVIADCPSRAYLPSLLRATALHGSSAAAEHTGQGSAASATPESGDSSSSSRDMFVIHLADAEVVSLPEYQSWLRGFPEGTHHILAAADNGCAVLESSAELQARLNAVAPHFFPLHLQLSSAPAPEQRDSNVISGQNLLRIQLRPKRDDPLDSSDTRPVFDASAAQSRLREAHPEVFEALDLPKERRDALYSNVPSCIEEADREVLEVLFLGTGAALPSKYRNVTAIYLHLFEKGGMLLDCGEGTYGQLRRRYGAKTDEIIAGLKCVWISHIHADHHAGLGRILAVRTRLLGRSAAPLLVIAPRTFQRVLTAVRKLEPMAFRYVDCACTCVGAAQGGEEDAARSALLAARESLGLTRLESFRVQHCAHAFGIVLESSSGWKVAVSGDTRPCAAVAEAAKDATLLIHEATFESSLKEGTSEYEFEQEALLKRHSMTHEAVQTGKQAGAYRTILTHFSQRYPKIPVVDSSFQESTCIAFDLMSVNLKDLPSLPGIVPALQLLFQEGVAGEEATAPAVNEPNIDGS